MADEQTNDTTTTGTLVLGTHASSAIDTPGDEDWFRVTLEAGKSYGFSAYGVANGSFFPDVLGLFDAGGVAVSGVHENNLNRENRPPSGSAITYFADSVFFQPATSGNYFVSVAALDAGVVGEFGLTYFEDDLLGGPASNATISIETTRTISIDGAFDEDWIRLDLEAGHRYLVELVGGGTENTTLLAPTFAIHDGLGNYLLPGDFGRAENDEIMAHQFIESPNDASYFVAISALPGSDRPTDDWATGTAHLIVYDLVAENGNTRDTAVPYLVGDTLESVMDDAGDVDWMAVSLEAGKSYYFEMDHHLTEGTVPGQNSVLWMEDMAGVAVGLSAPFGALREFAGLSVTAESDGTYYLAASSTGPDENYYQISSRELDSLSNTAGADWLTLPTDIKLPLLDIKGGAGRDMMSFAGHVTGIEANLANGLVRGGGQEPFSVLMHSIEGITGTSFNDTLHGSDGSDKMRGLGGRDLIFGSAGARDTIDGGASVDTLDYIGSVEAVSVSLLRGRGWSGDAQGDQISNVENIAGSIHDDFLWGDHGNNRLEGSHGDDTLVGNGGDDYILAGFGTDVVIFSGNRADYTITQDGIRTDVIDNVGGDGHDILGHAEILRFADGDFIL